MRLEAAFPVLHHCVRILDPLATPTELELLCQRSLIRQFDLCDYQAVADYAVQRTVSRGRPPQVNWGPDYVRIQFAAETHFLTETEFPGEGLKALLRSSHFISNMTFSRRAEARGRNIMAALPSVQSRMETYTQLNYFECITHVVNESLSFDLGVDTWLNPTCQHTFFLRHLRKNVHWGGDQIDLIFKSLQLLGTKRILQERPEGLKNAILLGCGLERLIEPIEFADEIPDLLIKLLKEVSMEIEEEINHRKEVLLDVERENNLVHARSIDFRGPFYGFPEKYDEYFKSDGWTPWESFYQTLIFRSVIPKSLHLRTYHTMVDQKYDFRTIAAHFPFLKTGTGLRFANPIPPYLTKSALRTWFWPRGSEPARQNATYPMAHCLRLSCPSSELNEFLTDSQGNASSIETLIKTEPGQIPAAAIRSRYWETQLCELFTKVVSATSYEELEALGLYVEVEETRSELLQATLIISLWPEPSLYENEEDLSVSLLANPQPVCTQSQMTPSMVNIPEIHWILETMKSPGLPTLGQILPLLASISSLSWISSSILPSRKEVYFSGPEHFLIETVFPISLQVRNFCRRQEVQTEIDLLISKIRAHSPTFNVDSHACSSLRSIRPARPRGKS